MADEDLQWNIPYRILIPKTRFSPKKGRDHHHRPKFWLATSQRGSVRRIAQGVAQ